MARIDGLKVRLHDLAWRRGLDVLPVPPESRRMEGMAEEDVFRLQGVLQRLLGYSRDDVPPQLPEWFPLVTRALALVEGGHRPHAQFLQDVWVLGATGEQTGGFFVEIGAGDGQYVSNSLMLEREFGWTGILCEPNPVFVDAISRLGRQGSRLVPLVVGPASGETVAFVNADERSGVAGKSTLWSRSSHRLRPSRAAVTSVGTVSPRDMLEQQGAPQTIDYLSIDTEGSEPGILRAFPWTGYHVRYLTVRQQRQRPPRRARLDPRSTRLSACHDLVVRRGRVVRALHQAAPRGT